MTLLIKKPHVNDSKYWKPTMSGRGILSFDRKLFNEDKKRFEKNYK